MPNQPQCVILPVPIAIPRITLTTKTSTFDYYRPVQSCLAYKASKFLAATTEADEPELITSIKSFLLATQNDSVGDAEEKTAYGCMFPYDEGREDIVRSKYALTLLGPTTLMLQPEKQVFAMFKKVTEQHYRWLETEKIHESTGNESYEADDALRAGLAKTFKDATRVHVGDGEVVRFSWGRDDSPVHSEPDLVLDRVFMTALYGSEVELRRMCEWRGTEYGAMNV